MIATGILDYAASDDGKDSDNDAETEKEHSHKAAG